MLKNLFAKLKTKLILTLSAIFVVGSLASCGDIKSVAGLAGPWPEIKEPLPLVMTDKQYETIMRWYKEDPELITAIKKQSDKYIAAIREYNEAARKHNHQALTDAAKAAGWSPEDIKRYADNIPEKSK